MGVVVRRSSHFQAWVSRPWGAPTGARVSRWTTNLAQPMAFDQDAVGSFAVESAVSLIQCGVTMQDINPITNAIADLKGRIQSLRGYL